MRKINEIIQNNNIVNKKKETKEISSVYEFVETVLSWEKDNQKPVAFRGHSNKKWIPLPSIFRDENSSLYDNEENAVREVISLHPHEFHSDESMFDRLVRMQHFGFPTRLLDVTSNPLVALYFSTEDFEKEEEIDGSVHGIYIRENQKKYYDSDLVSCMANLSNMDSISKETIHNSVGKDTGSFNKLNCVKKLVSFINVEKNYFKPIINPEDFKKAIYVIPKMSNRRVIAQFGAFIMMSFDYRKMRLEDVMRSDKIYIQHKNKKKIRDELKILGIHAATLFPEIEKATQIVKEKYR